MLAEAVPHARPSFAEGSIRLRINTRCTRLWFTASPKGHGNTASHRQPKPGLSRADSTSLVPNQR